MKEFPLETLKEMPLEQYTNLNRSDSFCYWLESKTSELGSIWGGSSFKFGIYKYARKPQNPNVVTSDDAYAWYVRYHAQDRTEAYQTVLSSIISIAQHAAAGNFDAIDQDTTLGEVYKWKIAFLYSNKHLVPIYKRRMLVDAARALGFAQASKASIPALQKYLIERQGSRAFLNIMPICSLLLKPRTKQMNRNMCGCIRLEREHTNGRSASIMEKYVSAGANWGTCRNMRRSKKCKMK